MIRSCVSGIALFATSLSLLGCATDVVEDADENLGVSQQRLFTTIIVASGYGLCVGADGNYNGAPVRLMPCNGSAGQQWTLDPSNFSVRVFGNKCLDIRANGPEGSPLQAWDCNGWPNQKWNLVSNPNGTSSLMNIGTEWRMTAGQFPTQGSVLRVYSPGYGLWQYFDIYI